MPTLFMGTERERSPAKLESIGFRATDYVVGMDFPRNTLKSLYAREEVFALALREHLDVVHPRRVTPCGRWRIRDGRNRARARGPSRGPSTASRPSCGGS